jgi:glucose/arabinose dehydrogenase
VAAALFALVLVACGGESASAPPDASDLSGSVRVEKVADLDRPTAFAVRVGDDPTIVYVATQDGTVHRLDVRTGASTTAASFADRTKAGGERGLLGLAFSPTGQEMYAHFTDRDGHTVVMAVPYREGTADVAAGRVLLTVEQPFANHNGGQLVVDAVGNLLIALGDGGGGGDPLGSAQNRSSLLGKILRIRPEPAGAARPYSIPADNPFVGSTTTAPEIAFLGLRNPWRFSIDPATGDYWIGDVGENRFEEINRVAADALGANFGWNVKEASAPFQGSTTDALTDPVHEWASRGGSSAIGGSVYGGAAIPALQGRYMFADLAQRGLFVLDPADSSVTWLDVPVERVVGFGVDATGEMYVLSYDTGVYRLLPDG